jgi:hypothetical protein
MEQYMNVLKAKRAENHERFPLVWECIICIKLIVVLIVKT